MYNAICLAAINSLNGDLQILKFPPGSRRMMVDQVSTLIQNSGALNGAPIGDSGPELQRPVDNQGEPEHAQKGRCCVYERKIRHYC
jgi:hypothetical protein